MSGFLADRPRPSGAPVVQAYELTATKVLQWHSKSCMACRTVQDMIGVHLVPSGFSVDAGRGGRFWTVTGPGIAERSTDALYRALSTA